MTTNRTSFRGGTDQAVFTCVHVWEHQAPILEVVHEGDGDWQFLCGGPHADAKPVLVCLTHLLERDPTLAELGGLGCSHAATRDTIDNTWGIVNEGAEKLLADIDEHGWHVVGVRAGDGEPAFAYSVGMTQTLRHPEVIMLGLPIDLMVTLINDLGARIRSGHSPQVGKPIEHLIGKGHCLVRNVTEENRRDYLCHAASHYKGSANFEALQCFWPSKAGLFPWDDGVHPEYVALQTDLSQAGSR